jgi:DNA invertase Pin-like site-specific DNA recombinase
MNRAPAPAGTVNDLTKRGVGFKVLTGHGASIHTTTPAGKLVLGIFAALSEFECELISERTSGGLASARTRSRKGGALFEMTVAELRLAMAAMGKPKTKVADLRRELGVTAIPLERCKFDRQPA